MIGLKNTGHRRAQRMYKVIECEICGGDKILQRHHKDGNVFNNEKENIQILCQKHHKDEHLRTDTWGRGMVKRMKCLICKKEFQPKRTRRGKLCGNPMCLQEMGRRSAEKRWFPEFQQV